MQLELPFDKEIESQRDIFRHQKHIIEVTLKDKYNFLKGELIMCTKGEEMIIGYAEVLESDCIMLRHSLIGEKYENTTWLMLNYWSIVKASKFRQTEYENKCKKHGYQIVKGEKVHYKACGIGAIIKEIREQRNVKNVIDVEKQLAEYRKNCTISISISENNTPNNFRNYYKKGVMQEIKESFKSLLNIK